MIFIPSTNASQIQFTSNCLSQFNLNIFTVVPSCHSIQCKTRQAKVKPHSPTFDLFNSHFAPLARIQNRCSTSLLFAADGRLCQKPNGLPIPFIFYQPPPPPPSLYSTYVAYHDRRVTHRPWLFPSLVLVPLISQLTTISLSPLRFVPSPNFEFIEYVSRLQQNWCQRPTDRDDRS